MVCGARCFDVIIALAAVWRVRHVCLPQQIRSYQVSRRFSTRSALSTKIVDHDTRSGEQQDDPRERVLKIQDR